MALRLYLVNSTTGKCTGKKRDYASEELFIKGINGDFSFTIIDLLGKEILHDHSANNAIQTRTLSEGLYLLKINKDKHTYLTKFIISREE